MCVHNIISQQLLTKGPRGNSLYSRFKIFATCLKYFPDIDIISSRSGDVGVDAERHPHRAELSGGDSCPHPVSSLL